MEKTFVLLLLLMLACQTQAVIWDGDGIYELTTGESLLQGEVLDTATLNITGGTINGNLICRNSSKLNLFSGHIGGLSVTNNATANLYGGTIGGMGILEPAVVNMHVSSYEYHDTGIGGGRVSGYWLDGISQFDFGMEPGTFEQIKFVPEPCSLLLLGLSVIPMRARRRHT
ncbi:MAG: hypothetical protein JW936_08420 [Sedimentisphaerales bacterium]|nr:hypothetical protein [Sedimentisphaerales bacterium]